MLCSGMLLLLVMTAAMLHIAEGAMCSAKVSAAPSDRSFFQTIFHHYDVANLEECIKACGMHPFCTAAAISARPVAIASANTMPMPVTSVPPLPSFSPLPLRGGPSRSMGWAATDWSMKPWTHDNNNNVTCFLSFYKMNCDNLQSVDTNQTQTFANDDTELLIGCFPNVCEKTDKPTGVTYNIPKKPNILLMLGDDMGYGDTASFGNPVQEWGPWDDMAMDGLRIKQMYSADSLCSPARVGLQTGRFPVRVGAVGTKDYLQRVYLPTNVIGLPYDEVTIAESLKAAGYKTGMAGKWHMGINHATNDDCAYCPSSQGYDFFQAWLPFSNAFQCDESGVFMPDGPRWDFCFLYNNTKIIQQPIVKENLTAILLDSFYNFLDWAGSSPWWFYFGFPQVHTDLYRNHRFVNSSIRGRFGDNMNEMSWAIGEIRNQLLQRALQHKTLVMFTADHGAHVEMCTAGGQTNGLKGGKAYSWEGGFRTPSFVFWPGVVRPGSTTFAIITHLDLHPTFVSLAGGKMPTNLTYDGVDKTKQILGLDLTSIPNQVVYYHCSDQLMAIRYKDYKIQWQGKVPATYEQKLVKCPGGLPLADWYANDASNNCQGSKVTYYDPPQVTNLNVDPWELWPLDAKDPTIAAIIAEAQTIKSQHLASYSTNRPSFMGNLDGSIYPCCAKTPEGCGCGYTGPYIGPPSGAKPLG